MMEGVKNRKIFVGLSGGVDSAVTAALLKEAGANVTGIFIKGWYPEGLPCTWSEDRRDAMRVAAHLGIPFTTLDASEEYKKGVIDYLLREYRAGRTPNPDVFCNRDVKFGAFYRFARERGADFIATGHYARIALDENYATAERACSEKGAGIAGLVPEHFAGSMPVEQHTFHLMRGLDDSKDQSYFLWAIPKETLPHVLFPLGAMKKQEVRTLAQKFSLPVAAKRDSQGICFLGPVSVADFLKHEVGSEPGDAFDGAKLVGRHDGALLYTLGERVALTGPQTGPWYVIGKDLAANTLSVSREPKLAVVSGAGYALTEENFFADVSDGAPLIAQYRYHGPRVRGQYRAHDHRFIPDAPIPEPVSSGQSLVLYRDDELVGGGIIE